MDHVALRIRVEIRVGILRAIRALIGWICRCMTTMKAWRGRCALRFGVWCLFFLRVFACGGVHRETEEFGQERGIIESRCPPSYTHAHTGPEMGFACVLTNALSLSFFFFSFSFSTI